MVLEALRFFDAALVKFSQRDAKNIEKDIKRIYVILAKTIGHESPEVRECCHKCIRDLAEVVGVPKVKSAPFLSLLEPKRLEAIFKGCGKTSPAPAAAATAALPPQPQAQQKPVATAPTTTTTTTATAPRTKKQVGSAATVTTTTRQAKGGKVSAPQTTTVITKKKPKKPTYEELIATETELCNKDDAEMHFKEIFSEKTLENITSRSFKARLDGYDEVLRSINTPGFGDSAGRPGLATWCVLMEVCERTESNVQGSLKIIEAIRTFVERAAEFKFGRACIAYAMRTFVVSKLGEPKQCAQAEACLEKFAQASSYVYVLHNLFEALEGQRNTRCFAGALSWVAASLDTFGPDGINLEVLAARIAHNIGSNVLATSQKASKAAVALARFFGCEKVMAALEACEEKVEPRKLEHIKAEAEKAGSVPEGKEYVVTKDFEKYYAALKAYNDSIKATQQPPPPPIITTTTTTTVKRAQPVPMEIVEPEIVSTPKQTQTASVNANGTPIAGGASVKKLIQTAEASVDWEARQRAINGITQAVQGTSPSAAAATAAAVLCGSAQFQSLIRDKALRDPNKSVAVAGLECLEAMFATAGTAGGTPGLDKAGRLLLPAVLPLLGDPAKQKRESAARCAAAISGAMSTRSFVLPIIASFAASEKETTPTARKEALSMLCSQASLLISDNNNNSNNNSDSTGAIVSAVRSLHPLFASRQADVRRSAASALERLAEAYRGEDYSALERAVAGNEEAQAVLTRIRARQRCTTRAERSHIVANQDPAALETPLGRRQLREDFVALAEAGLCGIAPAQAAGILSGDVTAVTVGLGEAKALAVRGGPLVTECGDIFLRSIACVVANIGGTVGAVGSARDALRALLVDTLGCGLAAMAGRGMKLLEFEARAVMYILLHLRVRSERVVRDLSALFPAADAVNLVQRELAMGAGDLAEGFALITFVLRCVPPASITIGELSGVILMASHYAAAAAIIDPALRTAALDVLTLTHDTFGDALWDYVPSSLASQIQKVIGPSAAIATTATTVTVATPRNREESPQKKMKLSNGTAAQSTDLFTEEKLESIAVSIQKSIEARNIENVLAGLVELQRALECGEEATTANSESSKVRANTLFRVVGSLTKIAIRKDNENTTLEEYTLGAVARLYSCTRAGAFDLTCLTQDSINQVVVALVRGYSRHKLFHKFILVLFRSLEPQKILSALFKELTYRINEKNYELIARNSMVDLIKEATQVLIKDPRNLFRASIDRLALDLRQVIFLTKGNPSLVVIFKLAVGILNMLFVNEPEYMTETADRIETGHTKILTSYIQIFKESNNSNSSSNSSSSGGGGSNSVRSNSNESEPSRTTTEEHPQQQQQQQQQQKTLEGRLKRDYLQAPADSAGKTPQRNSPRQHTTPKTPKQAQPASPLTFVPALSRLTPKSASKTAAQYGDSLSEVGRLRERLQNIGNARSFIGTNVTSMQQSSQPQPTTSSSSSSSSSSQQSIAVLAFPHPPASSAYKTPSQELKERVESIINGTKEPATSQPQEGSTSNPYF